MLLIKIIGLKLLKKPAYIILIKMIIILFFNIMIRIKILKLITNHLYILYVTHNYNLKLFNINNKVKLIKQSKSYIK